MGSGLLCRAFVLRLIAIAATLALAMGCAALGRDGGPDGDREFRGVFVATAYNIDWPSRPGLHWRVQQDEIRAIVQRVKEMNCNVVILQVRAFGDRIHRNTRLDPKEPWAEPLNRTNDPDATPAKAFDPLAAWIEACHDEEIELHAWVNPFRVNRLVTYKGSVLPVLVGGNGHHLYLDPSSDAVRSYVMEVVQDLLAYPHAKVGQEPADLGGGSGTLMAAAGGGIDGMLFDHDLLPPDPKPTPTTTGPSTQPKMRMLSASAEETDKPTRAKWLKRVAREQHGVVNPTPDPQALTRFIESVSKAVREKPGKLFGISPTVNGPDTADAKVWVSKGLVDYVIPEYYVDGPPGELESRLAEWIDEADKAATKPAVIGGLGTTFVQAPEQKSPALPWKTGVIEEQIKAIKKAKGSKSQTKSLGHAFYTWSSLRDPKHAGPRDNLGEKIKNNHQPTKKRPFRPRPGHP